MLAHTNRYEPVGAGREYCMKRLLTATKGNIATVLSVYRAHMATKGKNRVPPRQAHYSSHIQICNVDNSTSSPSVLLFFDKQRYLFNAGEGIQRHMIEYKQRITKVTSILATRVSTDTLAGLPGMLLSQVSPGSDGYGDNAVRSTVIGPPGLRKYCEAFSNYASSFQLGVVETGTTDKPLVQEPFVSITAIALDPAASAPTTTTDTAVNDSEPAPKRQKTAVADPADALDQLYAAEATATVADANDSSSQQQAVNDATAVPAQQLGHAMSPVAATVVCYVCQLASIPGKLDPQKAAQLGVPKGPLLGELQRGKSVTAVSGRTVHPHEVMGSPAMPGTCLVLLDCPSTAYVPALQTSEQLRQLQEQTRQQQAPATAVPAATEPSAGQQPAAAAAASSSQDSAPMRKFVILHLGPTEVTDSAGYKAWLAGFGPAVQHVMVSSSSQDSPTVQRAATLQAQLNVIEPQVFSLQGFQSLLQQNPVQEQRQLEGQQTEPATVAVSDDGSSRSTEQVDGASTAVVKARNGLKYTLAPARYQGTNLESISGVPDFLAIQADVRDNRPVVLKLLQEYQAAKAAVEAERVPPKLQGISRTSFELTLLGTCSACPSNFRNVSAYYVDLFDKGGLLVDCGEDTMGQLERRFGREDAARRIQQLHAVWISHMHADHHGGLYPLLLHRQYFQQQALAATTNTAALAEGIKPSEPSSNPDDVAGPKPLLILGPWPLFRVLCQYAKLMQIQFKFIPNTYFYMPDPRSPPAECMELYEAVKAAAGLTVLRPFPVEHVSHSTGLQLESADGWKVVFSGDTRPCQSVINAAKGATLLVHEATFEDELQDEAIAKNHSTTAEALSVAAASGAYRTVLTHFSSRYPKVPVMKPPSVGQTTAEATAAAAAVTGTGAGVSSEGSVAADGTESAVAAAGGSDLAAVGSVIVGFDLMSINLADLPWMPKMLPVLDELFKEEEQAYKQEDEAA